MSDYPSLKPVSEIAWRIGRQGRAWRAEARERYELSPEKIEMTQGKLFWSERDRLVMVGLLLENVGIDKVIRLGDPSIWREAVQHIDEPLDIDTEND